MVESFCKSDVRTLGSILASLWCAARKQYALWADIRAASRDHMEQAFQQRRQGIVRDCRQLKADVDSYNQNQNTGEAIQLVLDFTDDIAEYEALKAVA